MASYDSQSEHNATPHETAMTRKRMPQGLVATWASYIGTYVGTERSGWWLEGQVNCHCLPRSKRLIPHLARLFAKQPRPHPVVCFSTFRASKNFRLLAWLGHQGEREITLSYVAWTSRGLPTILAVSTAEFFLKQMPPAPGRPHLWHNWSQGEYLPGRPSLVSHPPTLLRPSSSRDP